MEDRFFFIFLTSFTLCIMERLILNDLEKVQGLSLRGFYDKNHRFEKDHRFYN